MHIQEPGDRSIKQVHFPLANSTHHQLQEVTGSSPGIRFRIKFAYRITSTSGRYDSGSFGRKMYARLTELSLGVVCTIRACTVSLGNSSERHVKHEFHISALAERRGVQKSVQHGSAAQRCDTIHKYDSSVQPTVPTLSSAVFMSAGTVCIFT